MNPIVPDSFVIPEPLATDQFRLQPLEQRHNEADLAAWTSSIEHIRSTPGFIGRNWPAGPITEAENKHDLYRHELHRAERSGFTFAILSGSEYVGCLYLYPPRDERHDVDVRSWVRGDHPELDRPVYQAVLNWLRASWPWQNIEYAER